jgi:hypothetical protein
VLVRDWLLLAPVKPQEVFSLLLLNLVDYHFLLYVELAPPNYLKCIYILVALQTRRKPLQLLLTNPTLQNVLVSAKRILLVRFPNRLAQS